MKSADVKPATPAKSKPGKPFFTGAGEVVQEKSQRPPFFNHSSHPAKSCPAGEDASGRCIQTKLAIGKPGDSYEREADANADNVVMRLAQSGAPSLQAKCAKCEEKARQQKEAGSGDNNAPMGIQRCEDCEKEAIQQKHAGAAGPAQTGDIETRLRSSKGGGSPLPAPIRKKMESSFGADFSGVRVHTDKEASEMNDNLQAHAFTHGSDIYFNSGKYDPKSKEGQRLLAHELTHTVQQGAAGHKKVKGPESEMEITEAEKGALAPADREMGKEQAPRENTRVEAKKGEEKKKVEEGKTAVESKKAEEGKKAEEANKANKGNNGEEKNAEEGNTGDDKKKREPGRTSEQNKTGEQGGKEEHGKKGEKGKPHGLVKEAVGEGAAGAPAAGPSPSGMLPTANNSAANTAKAAQSRVNLGVVETELAALGAGRPAFAIAAKDAKDPGLVQQKQQADDSVFNFLNGSANLVRNLMAPGAQITMAVSSGAAAAKAMVNAESRKQQALATAEIRRLKKQAEGRTWGVIGGINARHQRAVAALNADAQAARAKVEAAHVVASSLLEINVAVQLPKIDQIYNEAAEKFRQAGVKAGDYAMGKAEKEALRYARQKDIWQEMYDDDEAEGVLDGPVHARKYEAREDAAREVGKSYRDGDNGLINEGKKQADELLNGPGRGRDLGTVNDIATKSRDALAKNYDAAMKSIDTFTTQAVKNAGMAKDSLIAAAHKALKATLSSLDQRLEAQKTMLAALNKSLADRIDGEASETIAVLTDGLAEAGGRLAIALTRFKSEINGRAVPDIAELDALLGQMKTGIASAGAVMQASVTNGLAQAVSSLIKGGGLATQEMRGLADSGLAEARQLATDLQPVLAQLSSSAISIFAKLEKTGAQSLDKTVAMMTTGFMNISTGIAQIFAQINADLTKGLEESAKQVEAAFIAAVDKDMSKVITEEAEKAAAEVKPRWKSILKVLLVIVVVLVVALVVGPAVIGFVAAGAEALGASVAVAGVIGAVGGGAIVGAASGAVIQMGNNVIDNKPLMEGVAHAAIIGAVSGALGGAGGALGGALAKGAGAVSGFFIKFGVNMAFDIGGNIGVEAVEAWREGRPMNWGQVMTQVAMSAAMNIGMEGLGKLKSVEHIQESSKAFGEKAGASFGGKIKTGFSGVPAAKVPEPPEVKVVEPVEVKTPEPVEVKSPEPGEVKSPEPGDVKSPEPVEVKTPEPGEVKAKEPVESKATEQGETKAPGAGESKPPEPGETKAPEPAEGKTPEAGEGKTPEHAEGKTPEGGESKTPEAGEGKIPESEADKFVKGSHPTGDGHEIKVLEDGRIIRCSPTCEELASRFAKELKGSRKLRAELKEIENIKNPRAKAKAAAEFDQKIKNRLIKEYRARVDDGISDERIGDYIDKGYRLNPDTGRFKSSNGLDLVPAEFHERLGGREGTTFDPENFDAATKRNLKAGVEERAAAKAQRDRTRTPEGYEAADKRMRDASEQLGNEATDGVMKGFGKKNGIGDAEFTGDGRNALDKIYPVENDGKWVAEAKGPNGQLRTKIGTIPGYKGKILEQGTEPYLRQTLEEMRLRGERTEDTRLEDLANDTLKALNKGKVRYFMVSQPVDAAGELLPTQVREFKID